MTRSIVTILVVGVVGVFIGTLLQSPEEAEFPASVSLEEHQDLEKEKEALATELAQLREQLSLLETGRDELAAEIARRDAEAQRTAEALATAKAAEAPPEDDGLAISFGELGIKELQDADWAKLALAIRAIDDDVVAIAEALLRGESPDPQAQLRIMNESKKLQEYAIGIIGKLPTHQSGNGEFSHPISISNLVSAYLDSADVPLSDAQRAQIERFGEEYGLSYAERDQNYGEDAYALEKVIDELDLKNEFVSQMYASLDADQYDLVMKKNIRGRNRLDTFSPGVMLTMSSAPLPAADRTALRSQLIDKAATQLGVDRQDIERSGVFDRWIQDVDSILTPEKAILHGLYKAEHATVAGKAQVKAMKDLADELNLSDEDRARLRETQFLFVPRITLQEETSAPAEEG